MNNVAAAEVCLSVEDFAAALAFYMKELGFRVDTIFPADDPAVAVISGHGLRVRLERLGGTPRVETAAAPADLVISRMTDGAPWVVGRAGMLYRDLIPGRLGGAVIASHIRIPEAGPVDDLVHYHAVGFQLIFCSRGWVRLVYEDQGPPFVLNAGDCVIQPPQIRHRVLESSANLEVIELSAPAEHLTSMDYDMPLPTSAQRPDRDFGGQRFCRSEVKDAVWAPWSVPGFEARETGVDAATNGLASVHVVRRAGKFTEDLTSHSTGILFRFVLSGSMAVRGGDDRVHPLSEGDACAIPSGVKTAISDSSDNLQFLQVRLATPSSVD